MTMCSLVDVSSAPVETPAPVEAPAVVEAYPRLLIARSQGNTQELMRAEARLLGASSELVCGVFGFSSLEKDLGAGGQAACVKHVCRPLVAGASYQEVLRKLRTTGVKNVEGGADGSSSDGSWTTVDHRNIKRKVFRLAYEQQQRVSALEQLPWHPGVGDVARFSQLIARFLREAGWEEADDADDADNYNGDDDVVPPQLTTFLIVETSRWVALCVREEPPPLPHQERNEHHQQPHADACTKASSFASSQCSISLTHDLDTYWDRFFWMWCRSDKPWSFSSSMEPYVAKATLNLLLAVAYYYDYPRGGASVSGRSISASDEDRFSGTNKDLQGFVDALDARQLKNKVVADLETGDAVRDAEPEGKGDASCHTPPRLQTALSHFQTHPIALVDGCCGTGTFSAVASASGAFASVKACDIRVDFLERARQNLEFASDKGFSRSAEVSFHEVDWTGTQGADDVAGAAIQEIEKKLKDQKKKNTLSAASMWDLQDELAELKEETIITPPAPGFDAPFVVIANTPWGRRFGNAEVDPLAVAKGILQTYGSNSKNPARAVGFLIPTHCVEELGRLMEVRLKVPLGKPAWFVAGTPLCENVV